MAGAEPAGPTRLGDSSAGPSRTSWGTALVLFGAGVVVAVQIGKAVAALPTLRADLGLSLVTSGWVIAAVNIAGGLFGLLLGAGVDRLGARRGCLLGLALAAVSSAGDALAPGARSVEPTRGVDARSVEPTRGVDARSVEPGS
jgi:MFS family permease